MIFKKILNNWHVKVICLVIAMVLVFFTRANLLKEEPVVVFLETITNDKYTFTEPLPTRVTLILKGEETEIAKVPVDDLVAYIDASKIEKDGTYQLPIMIKQNKVFSYTDKVEITVSPVSITTIIEEKVTKYLNVESIITGIPSHGYELSSRFINPRNIRVTGPKKHIEALSSIKTNPIDVTGKNSEFTTRIRLDNSDTLLQFPEGDFVEFKGIITETSVIKVLENVNIAVTALRDDLEIISTLPQIRVNVEGTLLSLQSFTKNSVSLTIDLKNITEPGTYNVPITYWTPKFAHVYDKSRDIVTIKIIKKSVPTP